MKKKVLWLLILIPIFVMAMAIEFVLGYEIYNDLSYGEKAENIMQTLDLTAMARKKAGKLSGGWQRRLSIAMALITDPQILFLDEPTLGLDVLARSELWDMIRSLKGKITIILTT